MWFCCQVWQCDFRACLGPLDVGKVWNGWSHVVHPCGPPAVPTPFLAEPRPDASTKVSDIGGDTSASSTSGPHKREECEVRECAVEVHRSPGRSASATPSPRRGPPFPEPDYLDHVLDSFAGGRKAEGREAEGGVSSASDSSGRRINAAQKPPRMAADAFTRTHRGLQSQLGVLLKWDTEDDNDGPEGRGRGGRGRCRRKRGAREPWTPSPPRAPSADNKHLESHMDYWRRQHHALARFYDHSRDDVFSGKVNIDHCLDFNDDNDYDDVFEVDMEAERMQYREIWDLRACLEEDIDELSEAEAVVLPADSETDAFDSQFSRSSPDPSPEFDMSSSFTSFDSFAEEPNGRSMAIEERRSLEGRREEIRDPLGVNPRPPPRFAVPCVNDADTTDGDSEPQLPALGERNSFGSADTLATTGTADTTETAEVADNEGSSTDASRLEQIRDTNSRRSRRTKKAP